MHVWDPQRHYYPWLCDPQPIEAEWDPRNPHAEMDFIDAVREQWGMPSVAIGQAWLDARDCAAVLEAHAGRRFVRGVRHQPKPRQMAARSAACSPATTRSRACA
jgi:predicted TIM-barrel fold metal-dependent hydrolase